MIQEAYCSFEVSKVLKEKGFVQETLMTYNQNGNFMPNGAIEDTYQIFYPAPTHQMAMAWLREEKGIAIIIEFDLTKRGFCPYIHQLDYDMDWVVKWGINTPMKYEDAVELALKYVLENLI